MNDENSNTESDDLAHYSGNREVLKEKFVSIGYEGFSDVELLELLVSYSIPRKNVNPIAKELIDKFGSLQSALAADAHDLQQVQGVNENVSVLLKNVYAISQLMLKQEINQKPILNSWQKLIDYCHVSMAFETNEQFRVLYLNRKNELLGDEILNKGTVDHAPVYPREILKSAIAKGATALILVHNHPSGDSTPSDADIIMTREIIKAMSALNITIHDHIIISKKGNTSFKAIGLL